MAAARIESVAGRSRRWRDKRKLAGDARPIVTLSPGAVGEGKAWPAAHYGALARALVQDGASVWVLGGPSETALAQQIAEAAGSGVRDLTGNDLRNAILALAAADVSVTNDSGLMHVSAALGTPTVAIFGPTSPWHWKPLNPIAAILEPPGDEAAARTRAPRAATTPCATAAPPMSRSKPCWRRCAQVLAETPLNPHTAGVNVCLAQA